MVNNTYRIVNNEMYFYNSQPQKPPEGQPPTGDNSEYMAESSITDKVVVNKKNNAKA